MGDLTARVVESLESVDAAAWDALDHGPSPFTLHGFLRALERSGSVGAEAGWQPIYVIVERAAADTDDRAGAAADQNTVSAASAGSSPARSASADAGADTLADAEGSRRRRRPRRARARADARPPEPAPAPGRELVGAVAAYVKIHSYGEYIFDWSWARASQQAGIPYYPKLVIAAPMTPATGRRLLVAPGARAKRSSPPSSPASRRSPTASAASRSTGSSARPRSSASSRPSASRRGPPSSTTGETTATPASTTSSP